MWYTLSSTLKKKYHLRELKSRVHGGKFMVFIRGDVDFKYIENTTHHFIDIDRHSKHIQVLDAVDRVLSEIGVYTSGKKRN